MTHAVAAIVVGTVVGLAIFALWRDKLPRLRVWLLVIIGLVEVGLLGSLTVRVATWLVGASNFVTGRGIGVACGAALLTVLFGAELWRTAAPGRRGEGSNRSVHTVMALLFPTVCLATGGIVAIALGLGSSLITQASAAISTVL